MSRILSVTALVVLLSGAGACAVGNIGTNDRPIAKLDSMVPESFPDNWEVLAGVDSGPSFLTSDEPDWLAVDDSGVYLPAFVESRVRERGSVPDSLAGFCVVLKTFDGQACDVEPDSPRRPLTAKGVRDVQALSFFLFCDSSDCDQEQLDALALQWEQHPNTADD